MKAGVVLAILGCSLVMAGARPSGGPRPRATGVPAAVGTPVTTPVAAVDTSTDTTAARIVRDSVVKAREDSITAAAKAPETTPTTPAPEVPPAKAPPTVAPERRCILDLPNTPVTRVQRVIDPATG